MDARMVIAQAAAADAQDLSWLEGLGDIDELRFDDIDLKPWEEERAAADLSAAGLL